MTVCAAVTDYGSENPLLYDYYGFDREFYELKFKSRGDSALSNRVVSLFKEVLPSPFSRNRFLCSLVYPLGWTPCTHHADARATRARRPRAHGPGLRPRRIHPLPAHVR